MVYAQPNKRQACHAVLNFASAATCCYIIYFACHNNTAIAQLYRYIAERGEHLEVRCHFEKRGGVTSASITDY